jgi:ubiquitin-protein ligase
MRRAQSLKRIQKELKDFKRDPLPDSLRLGPVGDDMWMWRATYSGPKGTPYEGGLFVMNIRIPDEYPFKPPACWLTTQLYHPNWSERGTGPRSPSLSF